LFCEKPLTRTSADAREALALLQNYPPVFAIGFVRRYMKKSRKIKQMLEQGVLGKIRYCNVDLPMGCYCRMYGDWFSDFDKCGGVIIDMLAHHVDLANWFFGEAESVYTAGMLLDQTQKLPSDYAAGIITYRNGIICNMMCSWQRFGRSNEMMEIYGEKGALMMDGSDLITYYPADGEKQQIDTAAAETSVKGVEQVNTGNGFLVEARHLVEALNGGPLDGMPTVEDGFRSLEIGLAMIESAQYNRVVTLPL
jgi:predicted dehydrogenase